ncbi:hypothetical protein ACWC10_30350 [Streptomyces sp. NPDC001595]|uniref:hypothetical protein n=1 Tax=Streptomyces sp. NPDC001532 TaxID=3154520 RepID=UPI0033189B86
MSAAPSLPRSRTWLRVCVLLLALLIPGAHIEAAGTPVVAGEAAEADLTEAALRPMTRTAQRAVVRHRPVRPAAPAPGAPVAATTGPLPAPPYLPPAPRYVVLRC